MPDDSTSPIHFEKFVYAIANHLCPEPPNEPGIACVLGRQYFQPGPGNGLYSVPTKGLSSSDAAVLQALIAKHGDALPALRPKMSDGDIAAFMSAYRALVDRPDWEPKIDSDEDRMKRREERAEIRHVHAELLKSEIAKGRIRIFDIYRIPQIALQAAVHSFLPREDAQSYASGAGLSLRALMNESPVAPILPSPVADTGRAVAIAPALAILTPATDAAPIAEPQLEARHSDSKPVRKNRKWSMSEKKMLCGLLKAGEAAQAQEYFGKTLKYLKLVAKRHLADMAEAESRTADDPFALAKRLSKVARQ
ncbi:hypothetical protein BKP43_38810 [Variovorax boronicumulans]|uniref:hypothetical protein n=1 Tax=Variovorax boronicumulans TaxID=436515 RepID=UPI00118068B9|nr:hypothetical protein [Variovorax boronicumulans]PBI87815.1 hypothetical protein BKP43_38810 [Variovorax boronicumulans]